MIRNIFLAGLISAILFSCNNETAHNTYFNLTDYFNGQMKELYAQKMKLDKTVETADKSDLYSTDSPDWMRELQLFYNSDISSNSLTNKYQVDSSYFKYDTLSRLKIIYSAKDSSSFTKQLEIDFDSVSHKVLYLQIHTHSKNFYTETNTQLEYIPLKEIAIVISQHTLFGEDETTKMRGLIVKGEKYFQ